MTGQRGSGSFAGEIALTAAAVGAAAWLDALRVSRLAVPPVPWAEKAGLASRGGALLLLATLATLVVVGGLSASRAARGAAPPVPYGASRRVLAGWAAVLAVLGFSGFEAKFGWMAAAVLAGLAAGGFAGGRGRGRAAPSTPSSVRGEGSAFKAALYLAAVVLWSTMWAIPAMGGGGGRLPSAAGGVPKPARPSFLFIVIDALRADHLGAYGYARPTSPEIDRFAAGAIRFDDAVAPSSWTLPAMASIFTSTYPGQHGTVEKGAKLPSDLGKIAGVLRAAGYTTAGVTANAWMKRIFGFDGGFDAYYDLDRISLKRRLLGVELKNLVLRRLGRIRLEPELVPVASEITGRATAWLAENGREPFFLYLHYMDVHAPYHPIPRYHGRFCKGHTFDLADHRLESRFRNGTYRGNAEVLEHVIELYDEDIAATDEAVGRLVDNLRAMGLGASTTILLTADHGEEFYEHGETTHGHDLYRETLHVPLLVAPAGGTEGGGRTVARRVSTLDIYPTILEMAGLIPPSGIEGISLRPLLSASGAAAESPAPRPITSQLIENGRSWAALYVGDEKLVRIRPPASSPTAKSVTRLFHLRSDVEEKFDAAPAEPALAARLAGILDACEKVWGIAGAAGKRPGEKLDPETLRQLRALGYVN